MLGIYERRSFLDGEKIWFDQVLDLINILHWHFPCEIIRMIDGKAKIKIGSFTFDAEKDDCFFCGGEEMHYIISESGSQLEIAILDETLAPEITNQYALTCPKLPDTVPVKAYFDKFKEELSHKGPFYREALTVQAQSLLLDIFRHCEISRRKETSGLHKTLIAKISEEFSFITFEDAVRYSGYSASHFSKMFKILTGMTFSQYLNIIKVENAIHLLRQENNTVTAISRKCGFSTIRNFNRVFQQVTGYTPRSLPKNYEVETDLRISTAERFDPTVKASFLLP